MLNEQDKKIDEYLTNKMTDIERQEFEELMAKDTELSRQVIFQKDLMQFFEERNPNLEKSLSELGEEFFLDNIEPSKEEKKDSNSKFWMFLLMGLILVTTVSGFFYYNSSSEKTQHDEIYENPIDAEKAIKEGMLEDGGKEGNTFDEPTEEEEDDVESEEENRNEEEEDDDNTNDNIIDENDIEKTLPPMASVDTERFQPSPVLESIMRENVRSDANDFNVTMPKRGQTFYAKNNIVNLRITGNSSSERNVKVVLYDNKEESFSNGQYILSSSKKLKNEGFTISFNVELKKGLYYCIIQEKITDDILYISKFMVK